ncbi:zf-HC2 domain-containing protein [Bradyrhizobium sp. LHD-71]|uniref:anti-sigma factor family protein n=1 Tax=Bradyrhizobium sp. LHD-71 TaxID=3072141 RepID=UPI00280EA15C|nr:zf-HC2 domain-containing protein [Bradyrhizobium sp. LHD-71]MDQ8732271.1 zf-HC2 domain-containing protein [Bradyrhizobium sp. LHD-71]
MQCDRAHELLGAYRDGELAPEERRAVAGHIGTCRTCSTAVADDERIGRLVKKFGRIAPPPALEPRLRAALDRAEETSLPGKPVETPHLGMDAPKARALAKRVAALAAACLVAVMATWWVMDTTRHAEQIEHDILSAHIRSLLQDSPTQVASSDQHVVRPWFAGRADFAPAVKDLTAEGFALLGGRLDYVADRRVAVVVYKRRLHLINVFMWPSSVAATESLAPATSRNGYNLLIWSRNGVSYCAISDLNAAEMRELQHLL